MDPNYTMLFPWNSLQANVGKSLYLTSREKKEYESSEEAVIAVLPDEEDEKGSQLNRQQKNVEVCFLFFFHAM